MMTAAELQELGTTIAAIAAGVGGLGYLLRKLRGGVKMADLLNELPARLDVLEGKVDGLHSRMDKAEADHNETLAAVSEVNSKVDTLDGKVGSHLTWSEGEMTRRTEAEAALWAAISPPTDDN